LKKGFAAILSTSCKVKGICDVLSLWNELILLRNEGILLGSEVENANYWIIPP
jgi:hypothetical protein